MVWSGIAPVPFLRAHGADGVRELTVGQERYGVDVIAIAVGRQADSALVTMAGVPLGFAAELGGLVPIVDERMQAPVHGLFVGGDAAGPGPVSAVIAEGRLAGVAAAASLGLTGEDGVVATRAAGGPGLGRRLSTRASLQTVAVQPFMSGTTGWKTTNHWHQRRSTRLRLWCVAARKFSARRLLPPSRPGP